MSTRRLRSQQLLLQAVRQTPGITRAQLAEVTGLSSSAVATGIALLIEAGTLTQTQVTPGPGRGRYGTRISPARPAGHYYLGIDFGHNHIHAALADSDGRLLGEHRVDHDVDRRAFDALDTGAALARRLITAYCPDGAPLTVAAGIPGPVDTHTGTVRSPTILASWVTLQPAAELESRLGHPVTIGNDADLGALGEHRWGAARPFETFIYIKASHGVGAGIYISGRPYGGVQGIAGEIGHIPVTDPAAIGYCRCGNRGCLETIVSVQEVSRQLAHTHLADALAEGGLSDSRLREDPVAARIVGNAGRTLGHTAVIACTLFNPEALIIGGELSSHPAFAAGVKETVQRIGQPDICAATEITEAALGNRAEVLGAVSLAMSARQHNYHPA